MEIRKGDVLLNSILIKRIGFATEVIAFMTKAATYAIKAKANVAKAIAYATKV